MGNGDFRIPNFIGGINESVDEMLIAANEARTMQNMAIDDGALSVCKGITQYTEAWLGNPIETIMSYYKDGTGILLAVSNTILFRLDGSSFTNIYYPLSSNTFDYVNFNVNGEDILIFTNGIDNVKVYNGNTVRDLKKDGANSDGNQPSNKAPKGKFIDIHYERLWIADDHSLYFSAVNDKSIDIEQFNAPTEEELANTMGGQIDIYTNDGTKIIGLKIVFDDILIFKEKSVFKIFGTSPSNYTKIQVFSANGAIADKSIQAASSGAYFLNKDGIYKYDGTNCRLISQKIGKIIKSLNISKLSNAQAVIYKDKYILAVPEGSSTVNNMVIELNLETSAFSIKRGFDISSFVVFGDSLLFTNSTGHIYEYDSGLTFNGSSISSYYETGTTDLGSPDGTKEIESIYFTGRGSGSIKISCTTDRKTKEKTVELTPTDKVYNVKLKNRGRLLRYRFENVNGSSFTIRGVKVVLDNDID